ncbi:MAG: SEC-C metal-binding domain-containing protein [Candidatus Margulisiibacteriota bacterium]
MNGKMKNNLDGKIKDGGKCVCDICGKTARMGGLLGPMSKDPQIACYDCMMRITAEEKGISIAEAKRQREKMFKVSNLFNRIKIEEYLSAANKGVFDGIDEANEAIRYIMNVWNTFDKEEKAAFEQNSDKELAAIYGNIKMNWKYLLKKPGQGRNEPCACGSGKKYKKCCLIQDELDNAIVEEWKKNDTSVIRKGMKLITGNSVLDTKLLIEYYWGEKRLELAREEGATQTDEYDYNEWLMNDYYLRDEKVPFVLKRLLEDGSLSEHERMNVEARIKAPKSVYAVTLTDKGKGVLLRDIFTHKETFIYDRRFSETATDGMLVFCRIFNSGQYNLISGAYRGHHGNSLLEIKKLIMEEYSNLKQTCEIDQFLRRHGELFGRLEVKLRGEPP